MKSLALLVISLILISQVVTATDRDGNYPARVQAILSEVASSRENAQNAIIEQGADAATVAALQAIIGDIDNYPKRLDSVRRAIVCLGKLHDASSVGVLVEHIAFPKLTPVGAEIYPDPTSALSIRGSSYRQMYPAVEALIDIGDKCLPSVLEKLATSDALPEINAALATVIHLKGATGATSLLERAIVEEANSDRQKRLARSLEWITRIQLRENVDTKAEDLLKLLQNQVLFEKDPKSAADAIFKLGQLRVRAAIPLLIEHIDFCDERRFMPTKPAAVDNCRVAAEALAKIGKEATQALLEASRTEDNRLRLICVAAAIREIHGEEKARELLDVSITQATELSAKARLEKVKEFVVNPPIQ